MTIYALMLQYLLASGQPSRALLIGDSLMKVGVAPALQKAFEAKLKVPVDNKAKSASGLARPDFYDWPAVARDLLKKHKYGTVVMFIGANDCQGFKDSKGVLRRFDSAEWRAAYGARLRDMASLMCEEGRKAYWLGLPPMEKASFDQRIRRLEAFTAETLATSGTCVQYVPVSEVLGTKGKFVSKLMIDRQRERVREADGVHITVSGGTLVAERLMELISEP